MSCGSASAAPCPGDHHIADEHLADAIELLIVPAVVVRCAAKDPYTEKPPVWVTTQESGMTSENNTTDSPNSELVEEESGQSATGR